MMRAVYAYDIPQAVLQRLPDVELRRITEEPASYEALPGAEEVALLIARQGAVNRMLAHFPNVRWLQLLNAGYERVDLDLLRRRKILFTNARSVYCGTIAEDVMAKLLFLARNYHRHFLDQQRAFWPDDDQLPNANIDLCGRTLSILGAGFIGKNIAVRARAFGMYVEGYDPYVTRQEGFDRISGDLSGVLGRADFVVTSLPVTDETRDIINDRTLAMMKPSAFLINVARGEIVDEAALCRALHGGAIRGAFLDVAKREPLPPESPLWRAPNLFLTPHRAAYGDQMQHRMCALIERNIRHYLCGEALEDAVPLF